MKRRFNYTHRQKIPRKNISILWIEPDSLDEPLKFTGSIDSTLDRPLPSNAEIYLEAYSGPVTMRFFCGTVATPKLPEDCSLTSFTSGLKPLFRVKVTLPDDEKKRLLARADSISPMSPDEVKSGRLAILPVERVDLGEELWRVNLEDIEMPRLQINSKVTEPRDISVMASEGDFLALAYPAVVRQILTEVLRDETTDENHPWLIFGANMAGVECPFNEGIEDLDIIDDRNREWIDDAVAGFAVQFEAKRKFITYKTQE